MHKKFVTTLIAKPDVVQFNKLKISTDFVQKAKKKALRRNISSRKFRNRRGMVSKTEMIVKKMQASHSSTFSRFKSSSKFFTINDLFSTHTKNPRLKSGNLYNFRNDAKDIWTPQGTKRRNKFDFVSGTSLYSNSRKVLNIKPSYAFSKTPHSIFDSKAALLFPISSRSQDRIRQKYKRKSEKHL